MKKTFDFTLDYVLENEKVLLRPLQQSDAKHLVKFSEEEPELWKYSLQSAAGIHNLENYIDLAINNRLLIKEYPFIVFDKRAKSYAGSTRFYDIQLQYLTMQLGFTWYGKDYQGTGLNKNCKYLLLQFAFEDCGMERVEFRADLKNEKSIAAMKSIGCKVDGILRSNVPKPTGGRRDSIVLSILKNEWERGVKQGLKDKLVK